MYPSSILSVIPGFGLAAAGGIAFWLAGLPAPWLAGSMVMVTAAALAGMRLPVPGLIRSAVYVLIGVQVGAAFTPQAFENMQRWPASLLMLAATVVAVTWAGYLFYWKVCGWDRASAFFASCPGALSIMLILAERERANVPQVTIVQCIRVFFLVLVLPLVIAGVSEGEAGMALPNEAQAGVVDVIVMLAAGVLGALVAERFRIPAGLVLGPIPAVAILEISGVVSGQMPQWFLIPAYVVLGLIIGARFAGMGLPALRDMLALGIGGFILSLTIAVAGALAASWLSGVSPLAALVAFAPGGLEAMTIMAFALNLDPAYVGTHQIARYLMLAVALPALMVLLRKAWQKDRKPASGED
ncbi:MAG: AbrB family transcriptional regulator [Parvibaculaceae bacterium]